MNEIFTLIKFGKKEDLEKLLRKGEVYFNTLETFTESKDPERGDENEGACWIENIQFTNIRAVHPILGTFDFKPNLNSLGKMIQYNFNHLSYSLYVLTATVFTESNLFQIDERMIEFGGYALMIKKPIEFLNAIGNELKKQNIQYKMKIVSYRDLSKKERFELTPFEKEIEFKHQNEYRITIQNLNNNPKAINIGSIEEYCILVDSKSIIETIWEAKRII